MKCCEYEPLQLSCHFLLPDVSGSTWIQTLYLKMMSQGFYHCATKPNQCHFWYWPKKEELKDVLTIILLLLYAKDKKFHYICRWLRTGSSCRMARSRWGSSTRLSTTSPGSIGPEWPARTCLADRERFCRNVFHLFVSYNYCYKLK